MLSLSKFTILFGVFSAVQTSHLSPDNIKLHHDVATKKGLYSPSDKVVVLNMTNFKDYVYHQFAHKAWVIEFYNSWCGHCLRFAPIWKSFALDIEGWKNIIEIGAVDCSNDHNTDICREYEIMGYPTIRYFPPRSDPKFLGSDVPQGSVEELRRTIITQLKSDPTGIVTHFEGKTINELWTDVPESVQFVILVLEDDSSVTGTQMYLDLNSVTGVQVRIAKNTNTELVDYVQPSKYPAVVIIDRTMTISTREIGDGSDRNLILSNIADFLRENGLNADQLVIGEIKLPKADSLDVQRVIGLIQDEERIKAKLHSDQLSDVVFQSDIEGGLKYSLYQEITMKKNMSGECLDSLKAYILMLSHHFPFRANGKEFLKGIYDRILTKNSLTGREFEEIAREEEKKYSQVFLSSKPGWIGCRGSKPQYRGYPCSLWTMFHTLTVHAEANSHVKQQSADPQEVLQAVIGYVRNFFGCTECANHFLQMATTMQGNVSSFDESILWLWKAHNSANKRLSGDKTEDPQHPKVQFPPQSICKNCFENNEWNIDNVLHFLKTMYKNISYFVLDDLEPTSISKEQTGYDRVLSNRIMEDDRDFIFSKTITAGSFNFNVFDVSLCLILYLCSVGIILLVCVKFLFRRTHRKKLYVYDIFNKV